MKPIQIVTVFLFIILLSACAGGHWKSQLAKEAGEGMLFYSNITQGYFKEFLFDADKVDAVELKIENLELHTGKWMPKNSLFLSDASKKLSFYASYAVDSGKHYLNIQVWDNKEALMNEFLNVEQPIERIKLQWEGRRISLNARNYEYAMTLPFDISLIGVSASSVETLNRVTLHYL